MPSSPEVWVPGELSAAAARCRTPRPGRAFVADPAPGAAAITPFEVAGPSALPESVLLPARRAAEAAGYAAGWARGLAASRAAVDEQATAARIRDDQDRAAASAALERAVAGLGAAADQLTRRQVAAVVDAEDSVVAVAFDIVDALLGSVLADDALRSRAAVARALSAAGSDAIVTVRLHPADHAQVAALDLPAGVTLVADPALAPGDALAVTGELSIDAGLTSGLARLREVLGR